MPKRPRDQRTARALAAFKSLLHAVNRMAVLQANQLHTFGLTTSQFQVLEALLHHGSMSQAAVSERMDCRHSNVSALTENLGKRGLASKVFLLHATLIRTQMSVLVGREQETLFRLCVRLGDSDPVKFVREMMLGDEGEEWMRTRTEASREARVGGEG
jgi:DNA-binding MarR family transcriptional regulator